MGPGSPPAMPTVISYARVSSGRQKRDGQGLQRQIEAAQRWAAERGLTLDSRRFTDAGLSASKGHHLQQGAALHAILQAAAHGQLGDAPTLLVEDLSRLSRLEPLDGLEQVLLPLVRHGIRIVLLEDGSVYDSATLNQDQGALLMLVLKAQAAASYSRKLKEYGLAHRARNRQQILSGAPVCPGWAPSWIELRDGRWQFNSYAPTVQRLIELMWHHGSQATARKLNAEGHKAPQGGPWGQTTVLRLLENPAVYGSRRIADPDHETAVQKWRKERSAWEAKAAAAREKGKPEPPGKPLKPRRSYLEAPDTYPPLLSRQDYDRLKAVIEMRTSSPKERGRRDQVRFIAQMLTFCECGARIGVRHVTDRKGGQWSYLICRGRERKATNCTRPHIRLEPVQAHLLIRLTREQLAPLLEGSAAGAASRAQALTAEQTRLEGDLALAMKAEANARQTLKERALAGRNVLVYEEAWDQASAAVSQIKGQLSGVTAELVALKGGDVSGELEVGLRALLKAFADGTVTVEQRQDVNRLLHRMNLRVTLDTALERVGLAIGDGEPAWQQLNAHLDQAALARGMSGCTSYGFSLDAETAAKLQALADADGAIDLGPILREELGEGQGIAVPEG